MPGSRRIIKRLSIVLLLLSTLLVYLFIASRALFDRNRLPLPFGFAYCLSPEEGQPCGNIQAVNPEAIRETLGSRLRGKQLILKSWIYSPKSRSVKTYLSGNGEVRLVVNDTQLVPSRRPMCVLRLKKGYNRITIRFRAPVDEIPRLTFSRLEEIPFYCFVLPKRSPSRMLSRVLLALDRWKTATFALVFFFLMFQLGLASFPVEAKPLAIKDTGVLYNLLRVFSFFLVFGPLVYYLNSALGLGLPDPFLLLTGLAGSLAILLIFLVQGKWTVRQDGRPLIVFTLIAVFVFLQTLLETGSFLPPPVQTSDLPSHLEMMQHYRDFSDILRSQNFDQNYDIYPQGIHAFLTTVAGHLHLGLQESVIIFSVVILIVTYFTVYLLSGEVFGPSHYATFFLAISLSHFVFIYDRFFGVYSFPSMVAILFFLLSLYFFLKRDFILSSLSLASAVVTYPYYAFFFIWVSLFLSLEWLQEPGRTIFQKVKRLLLYFALPLFSACVYLVVYLRQDFSQLRQGFQASFKINPFISMRVFNALLLLGGIYFLLKERKNLRAMRIILAVGLGFLGYYLPYYFFSVGSTYYFMKNMQYVILLSIPLAVVALEKILQRLWRKAWAKYAIWSAAVGIYVLRIIGWIRL